MIGLWTLLACQPDPMGLANGDIASIRVEPTEMTLITTPDAPAEADFIAYATMADGTELEMDLLSWKVSNFSAGEVDETGHFESVDTNGGITNVIAQSFGVEGSARVTVIFTDDVMTNELPESVASAFKGASGSEDVSLAMTYPLDKVIIPRNLEGLGFSWDDPSATESTVYRLHFQSEITDISVYTDSLVWMSNSELWEMISASNRDGRVTVAVSAGEWSEDSLSNVRQGPEINIQVNRFDARGSVLYWGIFEQSASIMRIPIGTTESEQFWTCEGNNCCIGCHALADDADRLAITHNGGKFSVIDVSVPEAPEEVIPVTPDHSNHASFKAISPDGAYMLGTDGPTLILYDLIQGVRIKDFQYSSPISHPDWSPDGTQVVFVRVTGSAASDMEFRGGEIVQVDFNEANLTLENEVVLKQRDATYNYYYPAYSPDGDWIVYNRSQNDFPRTDGHFGCYAAPDAEVWLMSRDGSIDIRLDNANADGAIQNSYPRWGPLPDDDVLWLAFSSRREYPIQPSMEPQIWIVGVNPELAKDGQDPSATSLWLPGQSIMNDNHLPVWWSK
jgi:hypothetical protein